VEKHIDTMGFILAAIVISITLLGDREARRSENQTNETRRSSAALFEALNAGRRLTPSRISEMVRQATVRPDSVVRAARLLNSLLITIVVVVGLDALRLIFVQHLQHPEDAQLLVLGLMIGAVATGLYGEYHARLERRLAQSEFRKSVLGKLSSLSDHLKAEAPATKIDLLIAGIRDEFPNWGLVPELQALGYLKRGDAPAAVTMLQEQHENKFDGYTFPVLVTTALTRTGQLDSCLPILEDFAVRHADSRVLEELLFDLGLANAHRDCLFGESRRQLATQIEGAEGRLSFDLIVEDFSETRELAEFGRAWSHPRTGTQPWAPTDTAFPITWLWQLLAGQEPSGGFDQLRAWRDITRDASALESLGFGLLTVGQGDEAVEMFDAAIRLNSSSPTGHWGWALAYFDRSWTEKAITGLKRARTCGLADGIYQLTDIWFHKRELPTAEGTLHILGSRPTLQDIVDLSLLGFQAPLKPTNTPQGQFAQQFIDTSRRTHEVGR